jgi:anti-sigma regulatory factor (Ser/Thr protein kinase)
VVATTDVGGRVGGPCSDEAVVPHRADAVPPFRRALRSRLFAAGLPDAVREDVELVAAELLGNAVRHARAIDDGVRLAIACTPQVVEIRVTDGGSEQTLSVPAPSSTRRGGRGLRIVERLCSDWGVVDHDDGRRTVWARLPVARPG